MKTNKILMILVALVLLLSVVSLSGCLGGDDANETNNTTPENNATVPEQNNTAPEQNNTVPENNTPAPPQSGSITIVMGDGGPETSNFVRTANQRYPISSISISTGESIRIMNMESRPGFRHLFHSEGGLFEDFTLDQRNAATLTFNQPGTYKIELLNHYSGEPFGTSPQILTITVA